MAISCTNILLGCAYFVLTVTAAIKHVVVETGIGRVTGITDDAVEFDGVKRTASKFLGIPFAKPPVGGRRFLRPEVPEVLRSYNATYHRPHCPQTEEGQSYIKKYFTRSEDCLYLNVYVPGGTITSNNNFPVMIWIYGGAFVQGGADIYSSDILSAFNDVIVVTFNYRLNVFGFISDGTKSSGNFGLWDQKMAIKWVHDNIGYFGGDASNVTLFGESAGAACVIYQGVNTDNKGLFQRIIAESGSPLATWAIQTKPVATFQSFAARVNCNLSNSEATFKCLRNKTTDELLSKLQSLDSFSPCVDQDFLKEDPVTLFANKTQSSIEAMRQFYDLDFLSGVNSKDGSLIVTSGYWPNAMSKMLIDISKGVPDYFFKTLFLPGTLQFIPGSNPAVVQAALQTYTDWYDPLNAVTTRENMINLMSDIHFFVPAVVTANKHADGTKKRSTYFYEFDHKPVFKPDPAWLEGAEHAVEIPYVFGLPNSMKVVVGIPLEVQLIKPQNEIQLSSAMMTMWTNFAKTGNPNTASSGTPTWPIYNSSSKAYLQISTNMTSEAVKHRLAAPRVAFWSELVPKLQSCTGEACPKCTTVSDNKKSSSANTTQHREACPKCTTVSDNKKSSSANTTKHRISLIISLLVVYRNVYTNFHI